MSAGGIEGVDGAEGAGGAEGSAGAEGEARPQATPFEQLGGEPGVRELVDRFYDQMALDERFAGIRALHPANLDSSRDKLYWFLCGWLGGPDLYQQRFGHPRLRARHLPFPIASRERDQWLVCMARAMDDLGVPQPLFDRLLGSFHNTADWMRNRDG
ncbi:MAG: group II truncated hemoglobin [Gammaproteobacteria bacterium]